MPNTFAPDSVAEATIFGVNISVKPSASSAARKPAAPAAEISKPARSCGWRSVVGAWSRIVGSVAVSVGRYKSNGGGVAGPDSSVTVGLVSSAPPGAWTLAVTRPSTCSTVSSGISQRACAGRTTCAKPEESRRIRKVTDFSSRLRCSQPAIVTRSPTCSGTSAAITLEIITPPSGNLCDPLGVRAIREKLAVPPHFRRLCWLLGQRTSGLLAHDEGKPAGHLASRWLQLPFLPALRSVFTAGREATFSASGGSLAGHVVTSSPRGPVLLVSVNALGQG